MVWDFLMCPSDAMIPTSHMKSSLIVSGIRIGFPHLDLTRRICDASSVLPRPKSLPRDRTLDNGGFRLADTYPLKVLRLTPRCWATSLYFRGIDFLLKKPLGCTTYVIFCGRKSPQ